MFNEPFPSYRMPAFPGFAGPYQELPKVPDFGFDKLFDACFSFTLPEQESDVVKVVDIFDLEQQDVNVTVEDRIVTVQGEYSKDLGATRIYEQFPEPEGMYLKASHIVKRGASNKLVLIFDTIEEDDGIRD